MSALERWRGRCRKEAMRGAGGPGLTNALGIALYSVKASEVETNLTQTLRHYEELPMSREHRKQPPGLRLALQWLREEMERGE